MNTTRRFVLLHHEGHGTAHFDLMLEADAALATWQFATSPSLLKPGGVLPCQRLADHRKAYLDYQGPVGGGRGTVTRAEGGGCEIISADAECWSVEILGSTWRGRFTLTRRTHGWDMARD
jgi:hypothetical protein